MRSVNRFNKNIQTNKNIDIVGLILRTDLKKERNIF